MGRRSKGERAQYLVPVAPALALRIEAEAEERDMWVSDCIAESVARDFDYTLTIKPTVVVNRVRALHPRPHTADIRKLKTRLEVGLAELVEAEVRTRGVPGNQVIAEALARDHGLEPVGVSSRARLPAPHRQLPLGA